MNELRSGDGGSLMRQMQSGRSVLMHAARLGHIDCVRVLVEAGADKEAKDKVCCSSFAMSSTLVTLFIH